MPGVVKGRVTGGRDPCWSGACRCCLDDLLRVRDVELGEQVSLGLGEIGGLPECACRAVEGAQGEQVQPARDDVGADAFFLAVVDRAQVR
jgi:hypothetical protein